MKNSDKKSQRSWDDQWREALGKNRCIYGCEVVEKTCGHLEKYLKMRGCRRAEDVPSFYTDDIEQFTTEDRGDYKPIEGAYAFFRKLRGLGLRNDEILVLIDRLLLGKSFRDIKEERGWTAHSTVYGIYRRALRKLEKRGFSR